MYAYLKGTLMELTAESCIVEVNGIGYNVRISSSTAAGLPHIGGDVKLYTYTSVREDAIQLMGFLTASDLRMFRQLITVNGIGPKGGLAILSVMDADAVRVAILTGDAGALSRAPGIGKKSAERVILELKSRIDSSELMEQTDLLGVTGRAEGALQSEGSLREAAEALTALGYSSAEAIRAVKAVNADENSDAEEILRLALKELY